jgi:hypothetical protein
LGRDGVSRWGIRGTRALGRVVFLLERGAILLRLSGGTGRASMGPGGDFRWGCQPFPTPALRAEWQGSGKGDRESGVGCGFSVQRRSSIGIRGTRALERVVFLPERGAILLRLSGGTGRASVGPGGDFRWGCQPFPTPVLRAERQGSGKGDRENGVGCAFFGSGEVKCWGRWLRGRIVGVEEARGGRGGSLCLRG